MFQIQTTMDFMGNLYVCMSLHKRVLLLSFNSFPRKSEGFIDKCFSVYRAVDRITESSPLIRKTNLVITGLDSCCSNVMSTIMCYGVVVWGVQQNAPLTMLIII